MEAPQHSERGGAGMTAGEALQVVGWVFLWYTTINIIIMLLIAKEQNNGRKK